MPETEVEALKRSMLTLDKFLYATTPDTATIAVANQIQAPKIIRDIIKKGYSLFLAEYEKVCQAVLDPKNKYEFPSLIIKKSAKKIRTLLGVDESA